VKSEYFSFERPNFHPEQIIVMKCSLHIFISMGTYISRGSYCGVKCNINISEVHIAERDKINIHIA